MSQRHTISGRRTVLIWLSVLIVLVVATALAVTVLFVYPNYQRQQQVEQHYQAGVAFQDAGDWDGTAEVFEKVIAIDATYKDARTRLAEVKAKQQEALATAQAKATAQAQEAKATATAEALAQLEEHYQKGLGYMNLSRWDEAKAELEQVFGVDPDYKDVQARLKEAQAEIAKLIPTATPTPIATPTPLPPIWLFSDPSWRSSAQGPPGWETLDFDDSQWPTVEELDFGNPDRIGNMNSQAKWIWHPRSQNSYDVPFFFRKKLELTSKPSIASVFISADDDYYLHVNGDSVGSDSGWHAWEIADEYDIAPYLVEGENVIAVKTINTQQAGWLLISVFIKY